MSRVPAVLGVTAVALLHLASGASYTKPANCSEDLAIVSGIVARHRVPNFATCKKRCDDHQNCTGFNYQRRAKKAKCVLNSETAGTDGQRLIWKPSYTYIGMPDNYAHKRTFETTACTHFKGKGCQPIDEFGSHETVVARRDTYGWWGRDCWPSATDDYWYEMTHFDNRRNLLVYSSEAAFTSDAHQSVSLPFACDGANHVVYKRVFYCGGYNVPQIYTYDLDSGVQLDTIDFTSVEGRAAGHRSTCHYHWGGYSALDMASDEFGLWVIWGRRHEECAFAISKIDHVTKTIVKSWFVPRGLQFDKNDYGNAFMVCGNMYVMNHHHHRNTYVRWIYYTGNSTWVEISGSDTNRIILENNNVYNNYLNYSPRDQKLYSWEHTRHNRYQAYFKDW